MANRLSKIYTRTGDDGTTGISGNLRLPKNSLRIETLGTLDELNCAVGMTLAYPVPQDVEACLLQVQQDLFNTGGELCPPHHNVITTDKITALETQLDIWNETLPPLKEFLLPGGSPAAANCHLARAICRRAERCLVALHQAEPVNLNILRYINRLSDLLFVAARIIAPHNEVVWEHNKL